MKAIIVKYLGATDTKGTRLKASDGDNNQLTLSRDYSLDFDKDARRVAEAFINKMGWNVVISGQGGLKNSEVFTITHKSESERAA